MTTTATEVKTPKDEMIDIKRADGGHASAEPGDWAALVKAVENVGAVIKRIVNRYYTRAALHERARHLATDHGADNSGLKPLHSPFQRIAELVWGLVGMLQGFKPFRRGPSPKQAEEKAERQRAEEDLQAARMRKLGEDLERSGYGKVARQIENLPKTMRASSV